MVLTDCSSATSFATSRLLVLTRTTLHRNGIVLPQRPPAPDSVGPLSGNSLALRCSNGPPRQFVVKASISSAATVKVIDGKLVAKQIREEIASEVSTMKDAIGVVPGLVVILVGSRKDFATYVRNKKKACESAGINSFEVICQKIPQSKKYRIFVTLMMILLSMEY